MFIAALFTIARKWKQPGCLLTDEWLKTWHMYKVEYHSAIKIMKSDHYQRLDAPRDCDKTEVT